MDQPEKPVTPAVGMGATVCMRGDRHAATIIAVSASGKQVTVQQDRATRTDKNGASEDQTYTYEHNLTALPEVYTLRRNGRWVRAGSAMRNGTSLTIGHRREFYDYSF